MFKHQNLQMFGSKVNKHMIIFYPLEVVGRDRETQLQMGKS